MGADEHAHDVVEQHAGTEEEVARLGTSPAQAAVSELEIGAASTTVFTPPATFKPIRCPLLR